MFFVLVLAGGGGDFGDDGGVVGEMMRVGFGVWVVQGC